MAGSIGTSGGSRPPYEGYWSPYRFGGGDVTTDEGCRCSKKPHIRCQEWAELRQLPEKEWMTGWRDDGRMRGAIFQFFFQKFLLLDSCRLKELLNKGRHFWWSHLSQGGGSLFCILSLFYIYLGNLEVSNWVSDWVVQHANWWVSITRMFSESNPEVMHGLLQVLPGRRKWGAQRNQRKEPGLKIRNQKDMQVYREVRIWKESNQFRYDQIQISDAQECHAQPCPSQDDSRECETDRAGSTPFFFSPFLSCHLL